MRDLRLAFAAALVMGSAAAAASHEAGVSPPAGIVTVQDAPSLPPCTCRARGQVFQMGESVCLDTPDGPRLALCVMDQNVSSWRRTPATCPSARAGGRVL